MNKLLITSFPQSGAERQVIALMNERQQAVELRVCPKKSKSLLGNIYVGQVENVVQNLQAAFVRIGKDERCFLPLKEEKYAVYGDGREHKKLCAGDMILVQIRQEALKMKVPSVTTNLNFTGKYLVLTTGDTKLGISSKLSKEKASELRTLLKEHKKASYGMIVRTNAGEGSHEEILEELARLEERLERIVKHGPQRPCFTLLLENEPAFINVVRDSSQQELEEIVTDDPEVYQLLGQYQKENDSFCKVKIRLYEDTAYPLYKLYRLEKAFEDALKEKVWLENGGFLMIQQTEAFVCIDVNSGKYIGKKDAEEAYLKTNQQAAKEIARQLRLRNLSGIILVDFINMAKEENRKTIMDLLKKELKKDPVRAKVVDITALQIVEMTRKKMRKSLQEELQLDFS